MKYTVCVGVDGYINIEVEARSLDEAKENAFEQIPRSAYENLEDVELRCASVIDAEGRSTHYGF